MTYLIPSGVLVILFFFYQASKLGRRPKNYPPGPPTLPLLGNLHQMPKKNPHLQFKKWAEEYGPVYSLILGSQVMIVLSSDDAIKDLLDKRSGIYSSRPEMYLGNILSGNLRMVFMPYGSRWRMVRRILQNNLNINAAKSYIPYQDLENKQMMIDILQQPHLFIDHIRRYSNSLTTQMVFGFRTTSIHDPKLLALYHGLHEFSQILSTTTATVLDLFPIFKCLPDVMLPLRRYAKQLHQKEKALYLGHWMDVKEKIKNGTANPSFCDGFFNAQNAEGFSDDLACYISGAMLEAGSDTTAATLVGFVQAMVVFPEVAKKAQEEIDRVCGGRIPTTDDEPNLPYIRGCVKESLRWMPTAILGVNHAVTRDDEYLGYLIPKEASIMSNVWTIHNNPSRYPDPRRFDPSRYANDAQSAAEAASNPDVTARDHFTFGAGRRKCPGMHIAERSLFLAISCLLWAFDFCKAIDENGHEITPDIDALTEGLLVQPRPFPARIIPRNEKKTVKVWEEWRKVVPLLDEKMQWKKIPDGLFSVRVSPTDNERGNNSDSIIDEKEALEARKI